MELSFTYSPDDDHEGVGALVAEDFEDAGSGNAARAIGAAQSASAANTCTDAAIRTTPHASFLSPFILLLLLV